MTDPLDQLRDYTRLQVRAGLVSDQAVRHEVAAAVREELPDRSDAEALATRWVDDARAELRTEQQGWPHPTDHERLEAVFEQMERAGIVVLRAVEDHWAATAELTRRDDAGERPTGIAWFTAPDVWHAVDHGMLEVNLWHPDTANVAPGDELLDQVLGMFADQGLPAKFDEGRIEVTAYWQRRG